MPNSAAKDLFRTLLRLVQKRSFADSFCIITRWKHLSDSTNTQKCHNSFTTIFVCYLFTRIKYQNQSRKEIWNWFSWFIDLIKWRLPPFSTRKDIKDSRKLGKWYMSINLRCSKPSVEGWLSLSKTLFDYLTIEVTRKLIDKEIEVRENNAYFTPSCIDWATMWNPNFSACWLGKFLWNRKVVVSTKTWKTPT